MSFAVVHMQKIKAPALKGIQIHHQREKESHTNPDIDKERSHENYDLANAEDIQFNEHVQNIIESQKVGTRKTRKDAVLVNELLITSDEKFFKNLNPGERNRFFEESYELFAERYGQQNIAYARVHLDEKTPHMHLGVVPMRDGKLQGKNVFNRKELQWLQDTFPKHMQELGFELDRGEKGVNREHIEMARFKKQTLDKEINSLDEKLMIKKDELTVYRDNVKTNLKVPAKRLMKNVEVKTGEKTLFGKEKTKMEKKPTKNVIISEEDYKELVAAGKDNQKLKRLLSNFMGTDMAKKYKDLKTEHEQVKDKYSDLVDRFNTNVNDYNDLLKENRSLKARIGDLTNEIENIYKTTREFIKERTSNFRVVLGVFVDRVKGNTPKSELNRLHENEKRREKENSFSIAGVKDLDQQLKSQQAKRNRNRDRDRGMEL